MWASSESAARGENARQEYPGRGSSAATTAGPLFEAADGKTVQHLTHERLKPGVAEVAAAYPANEPNSPSDSAVLGTAPCAPRRIGGILGEKRLSQILRSRSSQGGEIAFNPGPSALEWIFRVVGRRFMVRIDPGEQDQR